MMNSIRFRRSALVIAALAVTLWGGASDADSKSTWPQAVMPYVADAEVVAPTVVLGGLLKEGAVAQFKQAGVALVIDTRTPYEGVPAEKALVAAQGIDFVNIPMAGLVDATMVETLAGALAKHRGKPIVIHCHSGGRAEALWKAYQARYANTKAAGCAHC